VRGPRRRRDAESNTAMVLPVSKVPMVYMAPTVLTLRFDEVGEGERCEGGNHGEDHPSASGAEL